MLLLPQAMDTAHPDQPSRIQQHRMNTLATETRPGISDPAHCLQQRTTLLRLQRTISLRAATLT